MDSILTQQAHQKNSCFFFFNYVHFFSTPHGIFFLIVTLSDLKIYLPDSITVCKFQ